MRHRRRQRLIWRNFAGSSKCAPRPISQYSKLDSWETNPVITNVRTFYVAPFFQIQARQSLYDPKFEDLQKARRHSIKSIYCNRNVYNFISFRSSTQKTKGVAIDLIRLTLRRSQMTIFRFPAVQRNLTSPREPPREPPSNVQDGERKEKNGGCLT